METKKNNRIGRRELPVFKESCGFEGYDASSLMAETAKLRNLITKRGTRDSNTAFLLDQSSQI